MEQATRPRAQTPAGLVLGDTTVSPSGAQNCDGLPQEASSHCQPPSPRISPRAPGFRETTPQVLWTQYSQCLVAWSLQQAETLGLAPSPHPKRGCLSRSRKLGLPAHLWESGLWSPSGTSFHAQTWSSLSTQPRDTNSRESVPSPGDKGSCYPGPHTCNFQGL